MSQCALWYFRYGQADYDLCADELEAARYGVGMEDAENGAVAGVQFQNGKYLDRDAWPAYKSERARQDELEADRIRRQPAAPERKTRTVRAPWDATLTVIVDADAPSWLGAGSIG